MIKQVMLTVRLKGYMEKEGNIKNVNKIHTGKVDEQINTALFEIKRSILKS